MSLFAFISLNVSNYRRTLFVLSFTDCAMLVMVWHLPVIGTMPTQVQQCSLSADSYISFSHLVGMQFSKAPPYLLIYFKLQFSLFLISSSSVPGYETAAMTYKSSKYT